MLPLVVLLRTLFRRWTDLSLRMKGLAAFSVPVLALLVSATLLVRLEQEKAEAEQRHQHVFDMRAQLQNMYIVLISAESEIRGYALNGQEDGLQPFGMVPASVDSFFARIKDMMPDNAGQRAQLSRVQELVHSRLDGLKKLREYYQSSGARAGSDLVELRARAKISPEVLLAVNELATTASKLNQELTQKESNRQEHLRYGIIASVAIGLLGGALAVVLFTRGIARRLRRLERNASRLADGLPSDAPCPGNDELGRLATAIEKAGAVIAARSSELKLALEGGEVVIWELDADTGRIGYLGGTDSTFPPELRPATVDAWIAIVHSDDREHLERELSRIKSENGTILVEYRVVMRGGNIRWRMLKAQSHILEGGGRRLLGILADITTRKVASSEIERQARELAASREALQSQTRILQSVLNSMGDGVVVADMQGKFIVFNPAARQMLGDHSFGSDGAQWAQRHGLFLPDAVTLYPPDQLPFVRAIRGESVDGAEIFVKPAGSIDGKWISVTARPLREEAGDLRGGVVVIRDITAPKLAAEALELARKEAESANQAKSEFLSRMSHELRTPLNSILGFAQLLELENLGEEGTDNVYHILKGGYHLLDLINEILDLARIESGKLTISLEPVRMREALKDALDLVRPLAIQKQVSINSDLALRCDCHVHADRQRLKQVLLNLLSNAIKFNRSGGSVILSCEETDDNRLRIDVRDTGSGISPEGLRKIFTPFERLETAETDSGGTGLGLALSKRLIEAMGGTIGVESAFGFGSRFFVEMSIVDDPTTMLKEDEAAPFSLNATGANRQGTVLYIEDNLSNLRLVERIFAHRPTARLLSATLGLLGLDIADLHTPDWILLDVHLPDVSGEEVLRRLRANPRTAAIPVTVLSADATPGQINRLIEIGARDYLTKPLDVRKFINLLDRAISPRESRTPEIREAYAERYHPE